MIQFVCICLLFCLTYSTHSHRILPQEVYIWQKKWKQYLQPAIEQTTPYVIGWRFLAGEFEPDGQVIYPSIQFDHLQQTNLPLTAVYRFDRLRPLPSVDEVLTLIQQSPAYKIHHIHRIELDLDWPTPKLSLYIQLLRSLKAKLPKDVRLNITMIPDWMRSPVFPELTERVPYPVLQVHSVDNPHIGLFNNNTALMYIQKMNRLTRHPFYVALPTYGLKIQTTPSGTIYAIEGENDFKTGKSGQELYSNPQQVRALIEQLQHNTPINLRGIIWFRLPIASDQRNWSLDTWMAMIKHQNLHGQIMVKEIPDPNTPEAIKITLVNQGNIALPLPSIVSLRCKTADGLFPYQLSVNHQGKYILNLTKQIAPLNTHQERVIGWMRCD
ncbi:DUF3142 domain-containing protein [Commensalibacter communis]|uniref:DUF3142 domain-containing protein n=1 Tax=Commensalibacter communis TaxID=2972786 RepID=UPI00232D31FD|nr:DUF3142 domain-containing protein [Commensalibacter communis]